VRFALGARDDHLVALDMGQFAQDHAIGPWGIGAPVETRIAVPG
jgi:hypothetical protein